jgi:hypothetical protein
MKMQSNYLTNLTLAGMIAIPLVACGGPEHEGGDESSASSNEALTANGSYSWRDTNATSSDIGTMNGRVCWLSGVSGNLRPDGPYPFGSGYDVQSGAGVRQNTSTGHFEIFVSPAVNGYEVGAHVRCANAANIQPEYTVHGSGSQWLAGASPNRVCVLTQVSNLMQCNAKTCAWGFSSDKDNFQVKSDGFNWYLTGHMGDGSSLYNGATASARCFDLAEYDVGGWEYGIAEGDTNGGAGYNEPLTNVSGATCGLTGVGGDFEWKGWSDGAIITESAGQFSLNIEDGHTGWVTCFK